MLPSRARRKSSKTGRFSPPFERGLLSSVLLAGLPGSLLSLCLLWTNHYSLDHKLEATVLLLILWFGISIATRNAVVRTLQVLSNVVAALKDDDFSLRASNETPGDAFGDLAIEINDLSRALEQERFRSMDSQNLLHQVMSEVGSVILAFSPDGRVHLLNQAAATLFNIPETEILGRTAQELGITNLFLGPANETISWPVSGAEEKRWIVRRKQFRRHGVAHQLVVLSEASEALRAEERMAWQRLIRVLSHEINNSLAPIKSISRTLRVTALDTIQTAGIRQDLEQGLEIIGSRAESLNRFVQNYARASRLPAPARRKISLEDLITRVVALETRVPISVAGGPPCELDIDSDQIQQALINIVHNAADAVLQRNANPEPDSVVLSWYMVSSQVELQILDKGIGLIETDNLFVPFYTTKENGSGIGLFLARQIIESHRGTLCLRNRTDQRGCAVYIRLPLVRDPIVMTPQSS
jgi:nitrogen fixation/metabolism regulation signal transduction histidine kinase